MLSIISITLAFTIGIAWGLYIEFNILVLALIFLLFIFIMLIVFKNKFTWLNKNFISFIILLAIFWIGYLYTLNIIGVFDFKYKPGELNQTLTIISQFTESAYYYKYYAKNAHNDKFILFFKKANKIKDNKKIQFEQGTILDIEGDYELPNIARNRGGFNYRRYLNSNNIYGNIKVSDYRIVNNMPQNIQMIFQKFIYNIQNSIRKKFMQVLPKDYAGILNGMLTGDTSDVSNKILGYFKESRHYSFACCFWF